MFNYTDLPGFAANPHLANRPTAVRTLLRNDTSLKNVTTTSYADGKLNAAWWLGALARRPPSHIPTLSRPGPSQHQGGTVC